jgi:hypothetical protein
MTILHSQCLPTELVKTANAVAINSVAGPVTGVVAPTSAPATGASVWYIDTSTSPDTLYFWDGAVWSAVGDSSSLATQDEGVALGSTSTMNFVGTGVTATYAAGVTTVTIPGGGTSLAFQDEGVALASTSTVNFAGAGVVATNAAGVTTVTIPGGSGTFATNAEAQAGSSAALLISPANLYARENIAAQTGLDNDPALIAVPTAGQSNWGTTALGEVVHYMPNVGWKVVANQYQQSVSYTLDGSVSGGTVIRGTYTAHRTGVVTVSMQCVAVSNGAGLITAAVGISGVASSAAADNGVSQPGDIMASSASRTFALVKGEIVVFVSFHSNTTAGLTGCRSSLTYLS